MGWAISEALPPGMIASDGKDGVSLSKEAFDYPHFQFSQNLEAAWRVVENMRAHGYAFSLAIDDEIPDQVWRAQFWKGNRGYGNGNTPALSICRAALDAIRMNEEKNDAH